MPSAPSDFNPRPPCGGRRGRGLDYATKRVFQSTPSVWRATPRRSPRAPSGRISIHALRVEGDVANNWGLFANERISIHALRVEGDALHRAQRRVGRISIHALRVEGDVEVVGAALGVDISIHALRVEGDLGVRSFIGNDGQFQSTPSVWRATSSSSWHAGMPTYFNPRPPCGGRLREFADVAHGALISIHALRVEGDGSTLRRHQRLSHFNPRPPCGGRQPARRDAQTGHDFNPRPPCGGRRAHPLTPRLAPKFQSTPSVWRATFLSS